MSAIRLRLLGAPTARRTSLHLLSRFLACRSSRILETPYPDLSCRYFLHSFSCIRSSDRHALYLSKSSSPAASVDFIEAFVSLSFWSTHSFISSKSAPLSSSLRLLYRSFLQFPIHDPLGYILPITLPLFWIYSSRMDFLVSFNSHSPSPSFILPTYYLNAVVLSLVLLYVYLLLEDGTQML